MQVEEGPSNEVSDEATDQAEVVPRRGRKRVRNPASWKSKHVKKKGLRQNAPEVSVVGRPPAEESSLSVEYQIRNEKGLNWKVCQKAFLLIHGFGK